MPVPAFPPDQVVELEGWEPAWFRLEPTGAAAEDLRALRERVVTGVRERFAGGSPADDPVVAAVRRLFRAAGTDPTRHRPSSEALARRVLKGQELQEIHPLVDLNNLLSLKLMVPCCVVDPAALAPPFVLRRGREGEVMESLRGPFNLAGKPVLEDRAGPFGTPITDSERVRITPSTGECWLVAYTVAAGGGPGEVGRELADLLETAPVARLVG